jgi:hypothetical protein
MHNSERDGSNAIQVQGAAEVHVREAPKDRSTLGKEDKELQEPARTRKEAEVIALNERGFRIGATHHNATIPEEIIQRLRYLHEEEGIGYRRLGRMFNIRRDTVVKICRYERRGQVPHAWKRVKADGKTTRTSARGSG